jgi:nicotinate-nucleotide adenylyltransferase
MKIGLCGGTFDPFHRGHLEPVLAARETMGWDRVVYIPAFQQPFKRGVATTSGYHRFAMAVLATETFDDVFVSTEELERGAVSYTVDTLDLLRKRRPQDTLDWIIGDDNLPQLTEWKDVDRLFELANFVVLTRLEETATPAPLRPRVSSPEKRGRAGRIVFARNATVPISATEIRQKVRAGQGVDAFVHPRVSRYIQHYGLYREDPA